MAEVDPSPATHSRRDSLPWWTWLAPLVVFHLGTQASVHFQIAPGTSIWYLPIPLGFALIHWWGPRVLLGLYLNALLSAHLWDLDRVALYPLYALPETIEVGLSWVLIQVGRRYWQTDDPLSGFLGFLSLAIVIPILIGGSLTQAQLVLLGDLAAETYFWASFNGIVADLLGGLAVTIPLVGFLTPRLQRLGLAQPRNPEPWTWSAAILPPTGSGAFLALVTTIVTILALGCWLPVQHFWPLYSLPALLAAIVLGFPAALWTNIAVVVTTLLLPAILRGSYGPDWQTGAGLLDAHVALVTLCLAVSVTGCAISSLHERIARERALQADRLRLEEELRHREKMDAIGQLAGGVAHDFNNMLGGIIGAAEVLLARTDEAESTSRRYLSLIIDSANRSAELTRSLLTFARKGPVVTEPVDLHLVITDVVALLERTVDRRVRIVTHLQASHCQILGDRSALQSALLNMGINAAQAMTGSGGTVTITTSVQQLDAAFCHGSRFPLNPGSFLAIEIQDDGRGIPATDIDRIFEPFFTTKGVGSGTGLGLAAVHSTVVQHQGAISVASEPGSGACFQIQLPLSDDDQATPPPTEGLIRGTGRILLVDDEPTLRETARAMLTGLGYTVETAENGRVALDRFSDLADQIDLVILDMIMPEMDGRSCLTGLQAIRPDVRVLLVSGFLHEKDLADMQAQGLLGCVRKPYSYGTFSQAVHQAMRGPLNTGPERPVDGLGR